ncbi:amidohydrolase family protein [Microbacterium sp. H1-D42]|uniref:N-acyl-D-amino-acid deacylase family protein n=1 Tax=Microbacterium sp. H1-D42 TaxID=2925844 RepID=UPI001F52DA87|nr:amidohydrolase family protein [Microbacterium sp. H1-D42]UNK71127.1 amidohydrolase family protein [Microbacterium sp. H1-D42]
MVTSAQRPLAIRNARFPLPGRTDLERGTVLIAEGQVAGIHPPDIDAAHLPTGSDVIEADGRILMPGFIDAHSHGEGALGRDDREHGLLRQGVTGVVLGQDGISFAPTTPASAALNERYFAAINGPLPSGHESGLSVAQLLAHYARVSRLTCRMLVPAGTVRTTINGFSAAPLTARQLDQSEDITRTAIAEGATGISLGLEYVPGSFADAAELHRYATIAADTGLPLVAHVRGYEADAPRGLGELIALARETGAAVHVAHLHAPAALALPIVDAALGNGIDLTFDSYPYRRGNTILAMLALPAELQQDGPDQTLARLADPATRAQLDRDWFPTLAELLSRLTISVADHPDWAWAEGLTLTTVAERAGRSIGRAVCDLIVDTGLGAGVIVRQPAANGEADVRAIANHPAHLGSSDGIFLGTHPHPRAWGSFARMLRRHVLGWQDWSWSEAAEHLSWRAARRFGFGDRGVVRLASIADFCLVDPHSLADRATYDSPTLLADGIADVIVAGRPVLAGGEPCMMKEPVTTGRPSS